MIAVLLSNLYPVPEDVHGKLPYLFLAYLGTVLMLFAFRSRAKLPEPEESRSLRMICCIYCPS
jgi:hypothetical protein